MGVNCTKKVQMFTLCGLYPLNNSHFTSLRLISRTIPSKLSGLLCDFNTLQGRSYQKNIITPLPSSLSLNNMATKIHQLKIGFQEKYHPVYSQLLLKYQFFL